MGLWSPWRQFESDPGYFILKKNFTNENDIKEMKWKDVEQWENEAGDNNNKDLASIDLENMLWIKRLKIKE